MSSDRAELLHNAVLFLTDPKVQSSSLTSKIQFLESKGLSESEIQEALRQASSGGAAGTSAAAPSHQPVSRAYSDPNRAGQYGGYAYAVAPPEPPRRDWRDLFIMAVISGGVIYGLTALARKYLLPHLQPPSSTTFQTTSSALTEQYDEAAKLLAELQTQTNALQESLDADRERVNAVVEEVEGAVKHVRDGEEKWREEMREIRGEVESIRELVPRLIDKHANSQSASLADLQNELRSLKTLLQSRQSTLSGGGGSAGNTSSSQSGSYQSTGGISETTRAANALLAPKGRGIPAWQMAPSASSSSSQVGGSSQAGGSQGGSQGTSPRASSPEAKADEASVSGSGVLVESAT